MVLFELMGLRYPYEGYEFPNQAVIDNKRPHLLNQETQALIRLQDLMKVCWDQEPDNRPRMEQVVEWIKAPEFESLRAEVTFGGLTSTTCSCVCRVLPEHITAAADSGGHNSSRVGVIYNQDGTILTDNSLGDIGTFDSLIEELGGNSTFVDQVMSMKGSNSMEENKVDQIDVSATGVQLEKEGASNSQKITRIVNPETQIWMCGRYKETKLLQISTYIDGNPGCIVSTNC